MADPKKTLMLVAHGSHEGPAPRRVTHEHADRVRATGAFDEVREAFWKTAPSVTDALRACRSKETVVVPLFMSEGYFVDEILPREIECAPTTGVDVKYTSPVGTHPSVTDIVESRAKEVLQRDTKEAALAVVGHGTSRHSESSVSAEEHANRLKDVFPEAGAVFLDEEPNISELPDLFESNTVVAVPLFVADGPHAREDVPEEMGLSPGFTSGNIDGTTVRYTEPVGTHVGIAETVVARAEEVTEIDSLREVKDKPSAQEVIEGFCVSYAERLFLGRVESETSVVWGEVAVTSTDDEDRRYELRHVGDRRLPFDELTTYEDPRKSREIAESDHSGNYRPLLWAPTLPQGWVFPCLDIEETAAALEGFYPGSIRLWHRKMALGAVGSVGLDGLAERHDKMYSSLADIDDESVERTVEKCCSESCLRRRLWTTPSEQSSQEEGEIPCHEPCSVLTSALRSYKDGDEQRNFPFDVLQEVEK